MQTLWDADRLPDDALHRILELGRVGGFDKEACLAWAKALTQSTMAASTMRVEQVTVGFIHTAYLVGNLLVGVGGTADVLTDSRMTVIVECQHTGKVTGVAHIHRIGNGGNAGTRGVLSCLQVVVENVVAVVGGNETTDGKAHALAEQTCGDVAEVAAGHTTNN